MFDEEYESDQEEDVRMGYKNIGKPNPKALTPTESNMTLSMKQGDELMKLMKERGSNNPHNPVDMKESELNRIKAKQPEPQKKSSKVSLGFKTGWLFRWRAFSSPGRTPNSPQESLHQ